LKIYQNVQIWYIYIPVDNTAFDHYYKLVPNPGILAATDGSQTGSVATSRVWWQLLAGVWRSAIL